MDQHDGSARRARARSGPAPARGAPEPPPLRSDTMEAVPLWVLPTIVLALAALTGSILVIVLAALVVATPVLAAEDPDSGPRSGTPDEPAPWPWP